MSAPWNGMCPAMLAQIYEKAVTSQRRAQAEFETSELLHRAKSRAALAESTRAVATAARGLQAALEIGDRSGEGAGPPIQTAPVKRRPPLPRKSTPAENVLLRQLLTGDLLPRPRRRGVATPPRGPHLDDE